MNLILMIVDLYVQVYLVEAPKMKFDEIQSPSSDGKIMLLPDSSSLQQVENFMVPMITIEKVQ